MIIDLAKLKLIKSNNGALYGAQAARGRFRVTVIDSMDEVNRNGANAMLKLLEEPPEILYISHFIAPRPTSTNNPFTMSGGSTVAS